VLAGEGVAAAMRRLGTDPLLTARYGRLPLARRRLANLASLAAEEDRAGVPLDGYGLVARLAERRRLGVDAEEASGEQLGSRGVRLMTIHGAKGLEWPVVFLPELGRAFDQRDLSGRVHAAAGEEGLEVACAPADDDGEEAVGLAAGLIADRKRRRLLAEESRLWYVACTRAREELHALVAGELPLGPRHDGSVDCYADWLVGAGTAWTGQAIDLDAPAVRAEPAEAGSEPLPPLVPPADAETPLAAVTTLAGGDDGEIPAGAGLRRSTAQALGTAIHEALERFEPGMSLAQAEGALAPFAGELDPHRRQRLVARLTDRDLIPGFKDAVVRLAEQPVIGERDGMLVHGQCDLLLKDAAGAWRLYDWKTGAAAGDAAARKQLLLYAELVAPHLDGPLVEAALVDVETGLLTTIPL
jgi:ATP-dependent exoDNAse (exonuclease V) beta subunit